MLYGRNVAGFGDMRLLPVGQDVTQNEHIVFSFDKMSESVIVSLDCLAQTIPGLSTIHRPPSRGRNIAVRFQTTNTYLYLMKIV